MSIETFSNQDSEENRRGKSLTEEAIAVVGMSARFPGAPSVDAFADLLWSGREGITHFSPAEADSRPIGEPISDHRDFVPAASALEDIDMFDASFFGLSSREAVLMDPQHRIFLECAVESLDDAAINPHIFEGRIGVFGGCGISSYLLHILIPDALMRKADPLEIMMGCDKDFIATRVSYLLNLTGPSMSVQTACSTSLVAIHMAAQSILSGECDAALAGGATITIPQKLGYIYHPNGIRSLDGHCRPFDADASGTVFGSGVGVVLLRPLSAALYSGDPIRAVLRASAVNNDGNAKVGFTAPGITGQINVLSEALALSGLENKDIGYIEAHGTATPMGDPIEFAAINEVYGGDKKSLPECLLGSVKSNVGHLDAAAGVAGFIKTVLCLERGSIPPTLHFNRPNPEMDILNSRFRVSSRVERWPPSGLRRAGVSSFGVGGTNVHIILEQASLVDRSRDQHTKTNTEPVLLTLSAQSKKAVLSTVTQLTDHITEHTEKLEKAAYTLWKGRRQASWRKSFVVRAGTARATLKATICPRLSMRNPKIGFIFAGQGSQHPGMSRALAERFPSFRNRLEECIAGFHEVAGIDLAPLVLDADLNDLSAGKYLCQTSVAQPAIFSHTMACVSLWHDIGVSPDILLGHSIGEWSAAVLAGIVTLEDAISLVARRAELMQAAPEGAMLSVPISELQAQDVAVNDIDIAVINGADICVLSGHKKALESVAKMIGNAKWLRTSHGFHSRYMKDAATAFSHEMAKVRLNPPMLPLVSNLDGNILDNNQATNPVYWGDLISNPVQFHKGLQTFWKKSNIAIECGPGDGLSGLALLAAVESGLSDMPITASSPAPRTDAAKSDEDTLAFFLKSIGTVWESGVDIQFDNLPPAMPGARHRIRLPATSFERESLWPKSPEPINKQLSMNPDAGYVSTATVNTESRKDTPIESMQRIWAEVLSLETVEPDHNFITLGGTSVIAMQLAARCTQEGLSCTSADIMRLQTPRELVDYVGLTVRGKRESNGSRGTTGSGKAGLSDACLLAIMEKQGGVIRLKATVNVQPKVARKHGINVVFHTKILRLGWQRMWTSVIAPTPIHNQEKPEIYGFLPELAPEYGLSGALSVTPLNGESACVLTVSLHAAAGSPGDAAMIIHTWVKACIGEKYDLSKLETLGEHRHAPLIGQRHGYMINIGNKTTSSLIYKRDEKTLESWRPAALDSDGLLLCGLVVSACGLAHHTRISMEQTRVFGLPPSLDEGNFDEILFALRISASPHGEPCRAASGAVLIDWLGDLTAVSETDTIEILETSTSFRIAGNNGKVAISLGMHMDKIMFHVSSTNAEVLATAVTDRANDLLQWMSTRCPVSEYLIAPEKMTASSAPLHDFKVLFNLEKSRLSNTSLSSPVKDIHPLTHLQKSMLFSHISDKGKTYIEQLIWTMEGSFDPVRFRNAWVEATNRHDAVRSVILWDNLSQPYQVVYASYQPVITELYNPPKNWAELEKQERELLVDICQIPPSRVLLVNIENSQWKIIWTLHHIILDGWSAGLFLQDVGKFYDTPNAQLPPVEQFNSFAAWTKEQTKSGFKKNRLYWRQRFCELISPTQLHIRAPETLSSGSSTNASISMTLCEEDNQALASAAQRFGVTLAVLLQGVIAVLLSRYSGSRTVCFGSVASIRPTEIKGISDIVGMFVSTLPAIVTIPPDQSLRKWIQTIAHHDREGREHGIIPLAELAELANVDRPDDLIDCLFVVENMPGRSRNGSDALFCDCVISDEKVVQNVKQALSVVIYPGTELSILFSYDATRFSAKNIQRLMGHYRTLLESFVMASKNEISTTTDLFLFDKKELSILTKGNASYTQKGEAESHTLLDEFKRNLESSPNSISIQDDVGMWTYAELDAESSRYCRGLLTKGIKQGDTVGLFLEKRCSFLAAILGILKAGASYCPLDIDYPPIRLSLMIKVARCRLILVDKLEDASRLNIENIPFVTCNDLTDGCPCHIDNAKHSVNANMTALKIFTSGTTGHPKGMELSHGGLVEACRASVNDLNITVEDRILGLASPCFDVFTLEVFSALVSGASVVLLPRDQTRPGEMLQNVFCDYSITVTFITPSVLKTLNPAKIPTLRKMAVGGEKMQHDLIQQWAHRVRLINMYGPAEICILATSRHIQSAVSHPSCIGTARKGCAVYVLDEDHRLLPSGVVGEICVASNGLTNGYINLPEKTASVFVHNPFWQKGSSFDSWKRMYRTGDYGWKDESGNLYYLERKDTQVKINGVRIEISEIEVLLRNIENISDAVVVAVDYTSTHDDVPITTLGAFILTDVPLDEEAIRTNLLEQAPAAGIPSVFLAIDALPLGGTGKQDRKELAARLKEHLSNKPSMQSGLPMGKVEICMADLWKSVLGLQNIRRNDHFFRLGGDSIKVLQLVAFAQKKRINFQPEQLFRTPIFSTFTSEIEHSMTTQTHETVLRTICKPNSKLSQFQKWIASLVFRYGDGPIWHTAAGILINGDIDPSLLEKSVRLAVSRHPGFCTGTKKTAKGFIPISFSGEAVEVQFADLRQAGGQTTAAALSATAFAKTLSLDQPPLLRSLICRTGEAEWVWIIVFHRMIADPGSRSLLFREAMTIYQAMLKGLTPNLSSAQDFKDIVQNEQYIVAHSDDREWVRSFINPRGDLPEWSLNCSAQRQLVKLHIELAEKVSKAGYHIGETDYVILATAMVHTLIDRTGEKRLTFTSPLDRRGGNKDDIAGPISDEIHITLSADTLRDPVETVKILSARRNLAIRLSEVPIAGRLLLHRPQDYARPDGGAPIAISYLSTPKSHQRWGGTLEMRHWDFPRYVSPYDIMVVFLRQDNLLSMMLEHRLEFLAEDDVKTFIADFRQRLDNLCTSILTP